MYQASFANFVDAPAASPRSSRLAIASLIACSTLALGLALAFTFERLAILRVPGPKTRFELAAVVIADPPKVADPPPKPDEVAAGGAVDMPTDNPRPRPESITEVDELAHDSSRDLSTGKATGGIGIPGGREGEGLPCPGGICTKGVIGIPGGGGTCVGPNCSGKAVAKLAPPKPLPLSSLTCIACADPNIDALRRTAAGMRKTAGTNVTRFCVDATGHVEAGSVVTGTSHGDASIDRLCRDAVKGWRFSPTKVAGEGRRACSEATFRIRFE